jgi:hypothetical protein
MFVLASAATVRLFTRLGARAVPIAVPAVTAILAVLCVRTADERHARAQFEQRYRSAGTVGDGSFAVASAA